MRHVSFRFLLNLFIGWALVLFTVPSFAAKINNTKKTDKASVILKIIKQAKQQHHLKAVIYGVWKNGHKVRVGAFGTSMTGVPATTAMHFRIGGVTQTFLMTLLMQLVEQHKISLSDTVSKWFPNYPDASSVTVKMLANSSSGYPDYVYAKGFVEAITKHPFKHWSTQALLKYAFASPMLYKPGTNQSYSHTNYVILGEILQKVTGESLSKALDHYIFMQLQLKNTKLFNTAKIQPPVLHAFSTDRKLFEDSTFWDPSWTSYSGLMTSNIHDLGVWANAFGSGSLLSKKAYQTLLAPDTVGLGKNTKKLYFAMGFGVMNHWLVQNPRFGGYSGVFAYLPEKHLAIVIFNTLSPKNSTDVNYSMGIFRKLVAYLAPKYVIPKMPGKS